MGDKHFDADAIRAQGEQLQKVAERLDGEIDAFLDEVQSIGMPAGYADIIGSLLGESYAGAEDTTVEALTTVVGASLLEIPVFKALTRRIVDLGSTRRWE